MSKFKIGDKVRCTDSHIGYNDSKLLLIKVGETYTVTDVDEAGWLDVVGSGVYYRPIRFELVESVPKFKVGDRVRLNSIKCNLERNIQAMAQHPETGEWWYMHTRSDTKIMCHTHESELEPYEPPPLTLGDLKVGQKFKPMLGRSMQTVEARGQLQNGEPFILTYVHNGGVHLTWTGHELSRHVNVDDGE